MDITVSKDLIVNNTTSEERLVLKRMMSFTNPKWSDAIQFKRSTWGIPKNVRLFEQHGDSLVLPRGSLYKVIQSFGLPKTLNDETAAFDIKEVPTKIKLRPLQAPWVQSMLMHKQGIGIAPAGSGKTVMCLQIIATLGQPTLWLTHRKRLMNQFKERAGFFIGERHLGTIGTIGDNKFKIGDWITVGMVQTLSRRNVEELRHHFGLIIVDEAHITPAQQAMKSVRQFAPQYLYGVTATPFREDRLEQIMYDTIGPAITIMDRDEVVKAKNIMPATIHVRHTGVTYNTFGKDFSEVMEYLMGHPRRNLMIVGDILTELALGNICIALTSRIEHGAILKEILASLGVECAHVHSELTNKQQEKGLSDFLEGRVPLIIATYQLLSDGFDHQPTSRIFFTLPYKAKGLIEQSKGRIERIFDGKEKAIVYDYVDSIPMLERQFESRSEQYHDHNLDIIHI